MASRQIPKYLKEEARRLWILGNITAEQISRILGEKYNINVSADRVNKWSHLEEWRVVKKEANLAAIQEVGKEKKNQLIESAREHIEIYDKIIGKSAKALDLENPDSPLHFEDDLDAIKATSIAIEGVRKIQKGVVSVELIQALYNVLVEEIGDENIIARIGARFKQLAAEFVE